MKKETWNTFHPRKKHRMLFMLSIICLMASALSYQSACAQENKTSSFCVYDAESKTVQEKPLYFRSFSSNAEIAPTEAEDIGTRKYLTETEKETFANAIPVSADDEEQNEISPLSAGLTPVSNINLFPYYTVCKLLVYYPNDSNVYLSTGFAVGKNLCAVARHSITGPNGEFPSQVTAYYGYSQNSYRYMATDVKEYIYDQNYFSDTATYDYAFIVWQNTSSTNTGAFGLIDKPQIGIAAHTIGFPASQGYSGTQCYESVGQITNNNASNIYFNMDFIPGQSGSPVYIDEGNGPYAIGNATNGRTGYDYNFGRRYTSDLISWLVQYGYV